jgi:hypothetical protein
VVLPAPESPAVVVATAQELAEAPGPFSVALMTATPTTASPVRRSDHKSLEEEVRCSYFGPVEDQSNCDESTRSATAFARCRVRDQEAAELGREQPDADPS